MSAMHTARALVANRHLNARYKAAIDRIPKECRCIGLSTELAC